MKFKIKPKASYLIDVRRLPSAGNVIQAFFDSLYCPLKD